MTRREECWARHAAAGGWVGTDAGLPEARAASSGACNSREQLSHDVRHAGFGQALAHVLGRVLMRGLPQGPRGTHGRVSARRIHTRTWHSGPCCAPPAGPLVHACNVYVHVYVYVNTYARLCGSHVGPRSSPGRRFAGAKPTWSEEGSGLEGGGKGGVSCS